MSKSSMPNDLIRDMVGNRTKDTQQTHESSTDNTQATHKQSTMKRYDVRMDPADWEALGRAAEKEGSSRGAIIRRLVRGYLY